MAAEGMPFPRRWNGGTISTVLGVIWGMSVRIVEVQCGGYPGEDDITRFNDA